MKQDGLENLWLLSLNPRHLHPRLAMPPVLLILRFIAYLIIIICCLVAAGSLGTAIRNFEDDDCPLSYTFGLNYGSKTPCNYCMFVFVTVLIATVVAVVLALLTSFGSLKLFVLRLSSPVDIQTSDVFFCRDRILCCRSHLLFRSRNRGVTRV